MLPLLQGEATSVGNVPRSRNMRDMLAEAGRPAHAAYMTEQARLDSFQNWPVRMRQKPAVLAEAGFYYLGKGDQTMCYHCGGGLMYWEDEDDPWEQHALWFNHCSYLRVMKGKDYIRKVSSGEVSFAPERMSVSELPSPESLELQDTGKAENDSKLCKICYKNDCNVCFVPCGQRKAGDDTEAEHQHWSPACSFLLRKPVGNVPRSRDECDMLAGTGRLAYAAYMTEQARLDSFRNWPVSMRQKPAVLAEAGFYYLGKGDQTMCYHCGGGLKDWEDEDDPWEQHALWFNHCPYLRVMKGKDYIRKVNSGEVSFAPQRISVSELPSPESLELQDTGKAENDSKLCKICYTNDCNVCFVPCGHVVACMKCATSMRNCPVCRQPYVSLVMLFFS